MRRSLPSKTVDRTCTMVFFQVSAVGMVLSVVGPLVSLPYSGLTLLRRVIEGWIRSILVPDSGSSSSTDVI